MSISSEKTQLSWCALQVVFALLVLCILNINHASAVSGEALADAALKRTKTFVIYHGGYYSIDYPNGDVPSRIGVCTDVLIRSYRALEVDLQQKVHEDMKANFDLYPSKRIWGLNRTDTNIDHRRVPNLRVFFSRFGEELAVSNKPENYLPGDIVSWNLGTNTPHIGIVSDKLDSKTGRPMIVHNIGAGPKLEDMLFDYKITGHYRYLPLL